LFLRLSFGSVFILLFPLGAVMGPFALLNIIEETAVLFKFVLKNFPN